jgi:hypothetical protein
MSYSRYFGMRSFENVVRNARFRTPKTGTPFKIGAPVMLNNVNPGQAGYGEMKAATNAAAPGANCGLVIFEHIQNKSDKLTTEFDSPHDLVPLGQYAQVMRGPGVKVWFKNQADKTLYDGRTQTGGSLLADSVDLTTLAPGTGLVPDGAGKFRVAADADGAGAGTALEPAWLIVEQANPSTGRVEARLTF